MKIALLGTMTWGRNTQNIYMYRREKVTSATNMSQQTVKITICSKL